jgi:hypothetical protein
MVCKVSKERRTVIVSMGDDPAPTEFDTAGPIRIAGLTHE